MATGTGSLVREKRRKIEIFSFGRLIGAFLGLSSAGRSMRGLGFLAMRNGRGRSRHTDKGVRTDGRLYGLTFTNYDGQCEEDVE